MRGVCCTLGTTSSRTINFTALNTRRVACSGRILGSRLWLCLALRWDMQVSSLLLFGLLSVIYTIMRRRSVLQACAKDALLEPVFDVS